MEASQFSVERYLGEYQISVALIGKRYVIFRYFGLEQNVLGVNVAHLNHREEQTMRYRSCCVMFASILALIATACSMEESVQEEEQLEFTTAICCDPKQRPTGQDEPPICCLDGTWAANTGSGDVRVCDNHGEKEGEVCPWKPFEICELPAIVGPCEALLPRWFYNAETGQCEQFEYGGCLGNENNFKTLDECERACPSHLAICKDHATQNGCEYHGDCKWDVKQGCLPVQRKSTAEKCSTLASEQCVEEQECRWLEPGCGGHDPLPTPGCYPAPCKGDQDCVHGQTCRTVSMNPCVSTGDSDYVTCLACGAPTRVCLP